MERDAAPKSTDPKSTGKAPRRFERPRGGQARAIADLMPEVGRTAFRRFGFVQSSVVTRWPEIVGVKYAQVCAPEAIRFPPGEKNEGILQLVVVPAHAPMVQHVLPEIIDRVNRFFGYSAVARVRLLPGEGEIGTIRRRSAQPLPDSRCRPWASFCRPPECACRP